MRRDVPCAAVAVRRGRALRRVLPCVGRSDPFEVSTFVRVVSWRAPVLARGRGTPGRAARETMMIPLPKQKPKKSIGASATPVTAVSQSRGAGTGTTGSVEQVNCQL
eukprot:3223497-Prymnesium_polylepis.1